MAHRPQKKWGQNFLRNGGAADRIVEALQPPPGGLILEIGPGEGMLTDRLARLGNPVLALEIDPSLAASLQGRFRGTPVEVRPGDATDEPLPEAPFWAVGNLPYNVATPIVRRVVASAGWRRAVFMFQKEVGDKITAAAGDPEYGFLTVTVGLRAEARTLMTLGPGSFRPAPKVRSTVVVLEPAERRLRTSVDQVEALASAAFRMRRKTLLNNLAGYGGLDREAAAAAIRAAGIDPAARAETLDLDAFDRLAEAVRQRSLEGT
ncbi:MAG TPA: 16S rRNA (adenine(1518)-N(6)/adenine(1519)-N(6))-dimethyltransferase RsmA [Thermoanaerobaculia bacterium]|nr:16S rRNA (adenine(1518)-N(6)/adenine(1519)-N(6))-dimethyltransferase RsmA [Thermoanaerobaculia bacterium]